MFRARVEGAFAVARRGTVVVVDLIEGEVRAGERVLVPLADGGTVVRVALGVEIVERELGEPSRDGNHGVFVGKLDPTAVQAGAELRTEGE
jgi:hypothetical protein